MTYEPVGIASSASTHESQSIGMFGYFPSYAIGELKAAQFFDAARRADSSILPALAEGDFSPWSGWLKENVHSHGSLYPSPVMMERATGSLLDVKIFKRHLEARYLAG
jgi:carboxypeptidase Taq